MTTVTLKVLDRLMLGLIIPAAGNFVTMAVVQDIHSKVRLGAEEMQKLSFEADGTATKWNVAADVGVEYNFTPAEYSLVLKSLKQLDEVQALTLDHIPLYKAWFGEGKVLPFVFPPQSQPDPIYADDEGDTD